MLGPESGREPKAVAHEFWNVADYHALAPCRLQNWVCASRIPAVAGSSGDGPRMKFWAGVTDTGWFRFLSARAVDEVNFWQPSAKPLFSDAPVGMPFLFKLRAPDNAIAGGGFFVARSELKLSLAWEIFGEKNGAASLAQLQDAMQRLNHGAVGDPIIGCTLLSNPFFLSPHDWIRNPQGWSPQIVRGMYYYTEQPSGRSIWEHVESHFTAGESQVLQTENMLWQDKEKYGEPILVKPRIGQGTFRVAVTDAYSRRCAMTRENTLEVLEAAHIVPYSREGGGHEVSNGLLLRSDFHKLFDKGLISVNPDYSIRVSPKIREAYFNGKSYYRLDGQKIALPDDPRKRPDPDRLNWHLRNRYQD